MANNYSQATLEPFVHLTDDQRKLIYATGGNYETDHGKFYVYWEESFDEDWESWLERLGDEEDSDEAFDASQEEWESRIKDWHLAHVLRWILQNPENKDIEFLTFQGASTCSKMRPGEFGGFALIVSRDEFCWLDTTAKVQNGKITVLAPEVQKF